MRSPTQWTWVWVNSGSWWWTGRAGMMQSMGSQRVGHDWVTELNWTNSSWGSLSSHSLQHLFLVAYLMITIVRAMNWYLIKVLICISLMISEVECPFIYLLVVYLKKKKSLFISAAHFWSGYLLSWFWVVSSFCILDINPLSDTLFASIFAHSVGSPLIVVAVVDSILHCSNTFRFNSAQFSSRSVVSDSMTPWIAAHQPPCPSPTPRVYSNSCPSSQWCDTDISSSVVRFASCPQPLPPSGSFPMSQLFAWGGQSIGVWVSALVLPTNTQDWSPSGWTGCISLQSKGLSRVFSNTTVQKHQFFSTQLSSQSNSHILHDH